MGTAAVRQPQPLAALIAGTRPGHLRQSAEGPGAALHSAFGTVTVSTPSRGAALTSSGSTWLGRTARYSNRPLRRVPRRSVLPVRSSSLYSPVMASSRSANSMSRSSQTGPGDITLAITGGTDRYRTARGFIHAVTTDTQTQLTVHIAR